MSAQEAPKTLRPVDDDAPPEDDEQDSEQSSSGRATRLKLPETRTLAIGGVIAAVAVWTVMLFSVTTSLGSLDESIQALRREVVEQRIPGELVPLAPATPEPAITKGPEPEPAPVLMLFGKPIVTDGADLWDCRDFRTWEQAMTVYQANLPDDPNFIDFDANGVPCETLRNEG